MNPTLITLLKNFKPEFGNLDHIEIRDLFLEFNKEKVAKTKLALERRLIERLTKICG